jgi:hypothetical protein
MASTSLVVGEPEEVLCCDEEEEEGRVRDDVLTVAYDEVLRL